MATGKEVVTMGLAPSVIDALDPAGVTCRDRVRQMLEVLDGGRRVASNDLLSLVTTTTCGAGHAMRVATLQGEFFEFENDAVCASTVGRNWLVEAGRPAADWRSATHKGSPPLREWQIEALDAWAHHGRIGVVEAVTGTGKSRVGVEAVREALADDYSVVVVVPTRDLVQQWCAALRALGIPGVSPVGDGVPPRFTDRRQVLVGTVQFLYASPPFRVDGKVLLIADECHRYGAGQWRRILAAPYRRRLGLTATFERNDDGLATLLQYFGGTPCYRIGFDRAIADGVVANYDVKLLGVRLSPAERNQYDAAHETVVDCRRRLIEEGVPEEPFGLFMRVVSEYASADDAELSSDLVDLARRYLKNFHERIRILSESEAKLRAARRLAQEVARSHGSLVFTRTIASAENIATALRQEKVVCEAIHSGLSEATRRDRLHGLKTGRTKALVAPTVLDEGVDVPQIDLAIVMGGSKSRRQMIQRMGRVLRLKPDGGHATFVVVYAENTVEDLTQNDGQEGCLDLIVQSADSVEHLDRDTRPVPARKDPEMKPLSSPPSPPQKVAATPLTVAPRRSASPAEVEPATLPMTRSALVSYQHAHGGDDSTAETALRETLKGLLSIARPTPSSGSHGSSSVRAAGFKIIYAKDRFQTYLCSRADGRSWPEANRQWELTKPRRMPEHWQRLRWPDSPVGWHAEAAIAEIGSLADLSISTQALDEHAAAHGADRTEAEQQLRLLAEHLDVDRDRCRRDRGRLIVARSAYGIEVDLVARQIVGYKNSGQYRRYGDYLDFGRAEDRLAKISISWREPDSRLEVTNLAELREVVDPSAIYYSNRTFAALTEEIRHDFVNSWDADRYVRYLIDSDLKSATGDGLEVLDDRFILEGNGRTWMFAPDGQSVKIARKRREAPVPAREALEVEQPVTAGRPIATDEVQVAGSPMNSAQPAEGFDFISALAQLAELRRAGALTEEEFAIAKERVLRG